MNHYFRVFFDSKYRNEQKEAESDKIIPSECDFLYLVLTVIKRVSVPFVNRFCYNSLLKFIAKKKKKHDIATREIRPAVKSNSVKLVNSIKISRYNKKMRTCFVQPSERLLVVQKTMLLIAKCVWKISQRNLVSKTLIQHIKMASATRFASKFHSGAIVHLGN